MNLLDQLAPLLKYAGVVSALCLSIAGAARGTAKSAEGVALMSAAHPNLAMRSMVPIVVAGVLGIYGLVLSVIIIAKDTSSDYLFADGCADLGAGLACGLACLFSGNAVASVGFNGLEAMKSDADRQSQEGAEAAADDSNAPLLGQSSRPLPGTKLPLRASSFITMLLNLCYAEALGLYGLVVGLVIAHHH